MTQKLIMYDLDNTLIDTAEYFKVLKDVFFDHPHLEKIDDVRGKFEVIERENIHTFKHSPMRYPFSMLTLYNQFIKEEGLKRDADFEILIHNTASDILGNSIPAILEGAENLVATTRKNHNQILLTQGDQGLQMKKLTTYGLEKYFDHIEIVDNKDNNTFIKVIEHMNFTPANTWMIGDSLKSDIQPALEIGANAIHFQTRTHTNAWHQHADDGVDRLDGEYHSASNLEEVLEIINKHA